ncbi:RHS domain-containing protein [Pseudomonas chlororaphis]|uniref:RHS domain-containing protein n=1 Tax=Pseudomonas chlororaphis TaxID=587753 RepID=UPI001F1510DA|nr:RHS domain-containing protein [Pseudomonas chlororaphis]
MRPSGYTQELTDQAGEVAWSAQYKVWGEVREQRSAQAQRHGLTNLAGKNPASSNRAERAG